MGSEHYEPEIRKSLDISWKEGIPAAITIGITDNYLVPYGLYFGATTQQIGFLIAIPHLFGSIAQLFAAKAVCMIGGRLKFIVHSVGAQAALLIPISLLAFFSYSGQVEILICLVIVFRILGNFIATAWGSLMSDYLPPEKRGHYFGWRSQIIGAASIIGVGIAGALLSFTKKTHPQGGFFLVFFAAACLRFISSWLLSKMTDIPVHSSREADFTFLMFIRRFKESNFVKYVLYVSSVMLAAYLAGPYFSVYMLRDLHFSYLAYASVQLAAVITCLLSLPAWGKHADVVGNAKILKITSLLLPTIPFLWLFSTNLFYLILVEAFSGFVWGGFNLCATNFVYDAVSPEKRVRCIAYFNLINGVAIFLGTTTGGFLADRLPPLLGKSLLTLFLISAVFRFLAHFLLFHQFREVRETKRQVSSIPLFFSVLGIKPIAGINQEWNIFSEHRAD